MRAQVSLLAIIGLATHRKVSAQQLPFYQYPYDVFGLSTECVDALDTVVECSDFLGRHAGQVEPVFHLLDVEKLEAVCTDECRSSLEDLRTTVLAACDPEKDVMVDGSRSYPATFNLDRYLHALDVSCYKDPETGEFCDLLIAQFRNETDDSDTYACHDCMLEVWRIQLESSINYDAEFAEDFSSVTASCSAQGYSYSTPPPYAKTLEPTSTESSTPTAEPIPCATPYTVAEGDTCETIAAAKNVSHFAIIEENRLDLFCHLPDAGKEICLPPQCRTHYLLIDENCRTMEKQYNVTRVQLTSWNSQFDSQCLFIERWRWTTVCVGPPGGALELEPPPEPTAAPAPPNAQPDSNERCASWYTVEEGDYCDKIANDASLATDDFYFLNQGLNENCSNLELGTAYCVKPVGDITTYPGYKVDGPSTTFTRPPTSTISVPIPTETLHPRAPGTIDSCETYVNAFDAAAEEERFGPQPWYDEMNECTTYAGIYGVTLADMREWNPSLSEDDEGCRFDPDYSYCVVKGEQAITTSAPPPPSSTTTTTGGDTSSTISVEVPENTQPGTIEDCKKFHLVGEDDGACEGIIAMYNLGRDDFYEWNPEVGAECTTLWLGYYVCVGV